MKVRKLCAPALGALLFMLTQPVLAEDPFHISYRQQNLSSDGLTQSGILLVTVVEVSHEDVADVMASVHGPNNASLFRSN